MEKYFNKRLTYAWPLNFIIGCNLQYRAFYVDLMCMEIKY